MNKFLSQASERNNDSDFEDSPKDRSLKGQNSLKTVSKFKPQSPLSEYNTEPTPEREKPQTTKVGKRLSTFENYKRRERDEETNKIPAINLQEDFKIRNNLVLKPLSRKYGKGYESQSAKNKQSLDLPKLTKTGKRKGDVLKKKKKKQNNSAKLVDDQLNAFLNLQTDPLLKMVYSPSFFATSFPASALTEEMNYKFDSYKFKTPSLLISEKI